MSPEARRRVAIVTGASRGIGNGLVAAFRRAGYSVVATSRSISPSDDYDILTVQGDIAQAETAQTVVEQAVDRFGRIDTLINNAGTFIGKAFTDYTLDDYFAISAVNLAGFFHITQPGHPADAHPGAAATSSTSPPAWSTTRTARDPARWRLSPKADWRL